MSYQRLIENMDAERLGPEHVQQLQQTRFIEGVANGMTGTEAAKNAGYGIAQQRTPWKLVEPSELRSQFQEIARRKGITLDRVVDKIGEHLEARANQTIEGKQVTQSEAPDYKIQQKAIEQLTGLIGMQDAQKLAQGGSSITVSVTGAAAERLAQAFCDREST